MLHPLYLLLLATSALLLGCEDKTSLRGRWVYDLATTQAHALKPENFAAPEGETLVDKQNREYARDNVPRALRDLEGSSVLFTEKELVRMDRAGFGTAESYEIVGHPSEGTWLVKTSPKDVRVFRKEGDTLSWPITPWARVYYRAAE